jgi:hypothetical protein
MTSETLVNFYQTTRRYNLEDSHLLLKNASQINLSLCLIKHHSVKMYRGLEVQLHAMLTSALYGGECSALRPGRSTQVPTR